jgi:uncharacterized protein YjbI with pentapeptide repeats
LTVLTRLDGERKGSVLQFLHESRLIAKVPGVLDLKGADLSGADLGRADLREAVLSKIKLRWGDQRGGTV